MSARLRLVHPALLTALLCAVLGHAFAQPPSLAYGYASEGDPSMPTPSCHDCHSGPGAWANDTTTGPHGNYTANTSRCDNCHESHAAGGKKLLMRATVTASCHTCHDGTGGNGVYGTVEARTLTVRAEHGMEDGNVIPGGDPTGGGDRTDAFKGEGGNLSCVDCHSPHNSSTVQPFYGDRYRTSDSGRVLSNKLLKRRPTGATEDIPEYGSDWCAACHKGRLDGTVRNHPVETAASGGAGYFNANRVAALTGPTSLETTMSRMPNQFAFLMPYPRTEDQAGHDPICQQCHEDGRELGRPGASQYGSITIPDTMDGKVDQWGGTANPRFQTFPHESPDYRFLVEQADDLCDNCHDPAQLP